MSLKVILAKPGLDGHNRGVQTVARALRDAGMEVVYLGIRKTPEEITKAALEEDADVIGLSCLSGAHMELFPAVLKEVRSRASRPVLLIGGGIIPESDRVALKEAGFHAIFTPGTPLSEIVESIKRGVEELRDA